MGQARPALRRAAAPLFLAAALCLPSLASAQLANTPQLKKCDAAAFAALKACFAAASSRLRKCYLDTSASCVAGDAALGKALAKVDAKVSKGCAGVTLSDLGYGPALDQAALIQRLRTECLGQAQSLASRTFGGPQGAVIATATSDSTKCLDTAYKEGSKLIRTSFALQSACVRQAHKGATCDTAKLTTKLADARSKGLDEISLRCGLAPLKPQIGLSETLFADRADQQTRCMVATAHADSTPLGLDCGPRSAVPVPPRGVWTQVVLDSSWGTQCADGSPYAFWIRLAPNGSPVQKVIVDLQGGGVCIFEGDCVGVQTNSPDLFEAQSDYQPSGPSGGWLSTNAVDNPFYDWTMIALPYCTQDVHIGGGADSVFPSLTVHRYGAVNVRATLRYLRDVLWNELDATTTTGYRPDILRVLFGGVSAGGFGTSYNYHYLLDDLRWDHTTAVPDSALGLDNGRTLGVRGLGGVLTSDPPGGWGTLAFQPPYAQSGDFAVVPDGQRATSPRLLAVPEQQILNLSNQTDSTQVGTTYFNNMVEWTNATRTSYCAQEGLPGIKYFLSAQTTPLHGVLQSTSRFNTLTADGTSVRDFLAAAVANPAGVTDLVEEGTLATDYPGVNAFGCDVN